MAVAVYLLRFGAAIGTTGRGAARYYLGYADDITLPARIRDHRQGQGAKITQHLFRHRISFTVVRVFWGLTRTDERRLKRGGHYNRLERHTPAWIQHRKNSQ